ncbi:MAG: methionine--tRNA ligase [Candidatus Nanoarchaeia archaeon]
MVYYITTAIDYPNANPHVGHAYEKFVADAYARWKRFQGEKVFFMTGLDEHGQKLQIAAENKGMLPQAFVDEKAAVFKKFCKQLNITNDGFIRTSEERHTKVAQEIFKKVFDKGDIYLDEYAGHYCIPCESYWTEKQLAEGNCPNCRRPTTLLREPSYFFKMSKYQEQLLDYMEKNPGFVWPESRRNEILSRLKEPLRDLSVSRASFDWGIPLPNDETHVMYVWFDALINYVSGIGYPGKKFEEFWPADVHVIGKDIIFFHTVTWPCMLFAAGVPPPKTVYVHGFINDAHGEKMSKSKGNVVDPVKMLDKYGADVLRYYLLRTISSGQDGNFSESELVTRHNTELANDLGNLVMRISKLTVKYFDGKIKNDRYIQEIDFSSAMEEAEALMDGFEHHRALDKIWSIINDANAYINKKEPWKIKDKKELANVVYNVLEALRVVNNLLGAFIPETSENIGKQLGTGVGKRADCVFGKGNFVITEGDPLFPKIEDLPEEKPLFPLDLRVAKVESVEDHPDAKKLYVLKIDLGTEKRQLVAGLKEYYKPEELVDKKIVVVSNLKYAKLRGVESQGMLLAADQGAVVGVLTVDAKPGDEVCPEGFYCAVGKKVDFKDFQKVQMTTDENGQVMHKNCKLLAGNIPIVAERVKAGAKIR